VFLVVDHENDAATLYVSDQTGQFYVKSMDNVVGLRIPGKFDVDIVKVSVCSVVSFVRNNND